MKMNAVQYCAIANEFNILVIGKTSKSSQMNLYVQNYREKLNSGIYTKIIRVH